MRKSQRIVIILFACTASIFTLCGSTGGCWAPPAPGTSPTGPAYAFDTQDQKINSLGQVVAIQPRPFQPVYGAWISDTDYISGNLLTFGSAPGTKYSAYTNGSGYLYEDNLRTDAVWAVDNNWIGGCVTSLQGQPQLPNYSYYGARYDINWGQASVDINCVGYVSDFNNSDTPQFSLDSSAPPTLTEMAGSQLTTSSGMPYMYIYDQTGAAVSTVQASSVASNNLTSTFPFPLKTSTGTPIHAGMFGTEIINQTATGLVDAGGGGFYVVGHNDTTYTGAFGVATSEYEYDGNCRTYKDGTETCTGGGIFDYPVVTLLNSSSIRFGRNGDESFPVGSLPVAVATFGNLGDSSTTPGVGTGYALVVNAGSNNVSIVDIYDVAAVATVAVGHTPVAVAIDSAGNYAYVANYADSTISQVSLSTYKVASTFTVGPNPQAVTIDSSGNLWVGGNGYVNEYNTATHALISTKAMSGAVNSLAVSAGLGKLSTTVVASGGTNGPTANAMSVGLASGSGPVSLSSVSATQYTSSTVATTLPTPNLLSSGTVVSPVFTNSISVSATPTGFIVVDLNSGKTILQGSTPGPVRGIAVGGQLGNAYLTVPDTNSLITVPLPTVPQS